MAAANVCLFEAIARGSLGSAVTLQFLGPLALALLAARRCRRRLG
jgi:inner membrane transporter RhtA